MNHSIRTGVHFYGGGVCLRGFAAIDRHLVD